MLFLYDFVWFSFGFVRFLYYFVWFYMILYYDFYDLIWFSCVFVWFFMTLYNIRSVTTNVGLNMTTTVGWENTEFAIFPECLLFPNSYNPLDNEPKFLYGFHMILHGFHLILYVLYMILYDFHMILIAVFHMIFIVLTWVWTWDFIRLLFL